MKTQKLMTMLFAFAIALALGACGDEDENNATANNVTTNNATPNNAPTNNATTNNATTNNATTNNATTNNATTAETVTFTAVPISSADGSLLDAEICERGTENCTTGTAEAVSVEVPMGVDVAISLTVDGHVTANWFINLETDRTYNTPLVGDATIVALSNAFSLTDDATKGHIFFQAQDDSSGIPGVAFELSPSNFELLLFNGPGGPDPSLQETSTGNGAFLNIDQGTYELTGTHASLMCSAAAGHQQSDAGAAQFEIIGGEATYAFVSCAP
jgi:hypothetical protein